MALFLLKLGRILATLGYSPATITALISFSFSIKRRYRGEHRDNHHFRDGEGKRHTSKHSDVECVAWRGTWQAQTHPVIRSKNLVHAHVHTGTRTVETQGQMCTQPRVLSFTRVYVRARVLGVLAADKPRPQKMLSKLPLHVVQHLQKSRETKSHDTADNL